MTLFLYFQDDILLRYWQHSPPFPRRFLIGSYHFFYFKGGTQLQQKLSLVTYFRKKSQIKHQQNTKNREQQDGVERAESGCLHLLPQFAAIQSTFSWPCIVLPYEGLCAKMPSFTS